MTDLTLAEVADNHSDAWYSWIEDRELDLIIRDSFWLDSEEYLWVAPAIPQPPWMWNGKLWEQPDTSLPEEA